MESAMADAVLDRGGTRCAAAPVVQSAWRALRDAAARWLARRRRSANIAHLDDRLLADAGFKPQDLGLGERLIRRYVAGGDIWRRDRAGD
jgi:uncharacterized protein YjiS (DUF1127 family)